MSVKHWSYFTVDRVTSLYLYGQPEKPIEYSQRMRPSDSPLVIEDVDAVSYMATGPGRYAWLMFSTLNALVERFFPVARTGDLDRAQVGAGLWRARMSHPHISGLTLAVFWMIWAAVMLFFGSSTASAQSAEQCGRDELRQVRIARSVFNVLPGSVMKLDRESVSQPKRTDQRANSCTNATKVERRPTIISGRSLFVDLTAREASEYAYESIPMLFRFYLLDSVANRDCNLPEDYRRDLNLGRWHEDGFTRSQITEDIYIIKEVSTRFSTVFGMASNVLGDGWTKSIGQCRFQVYNGRLNETGMCDIVALNAQGFCLRFRYHSGNIPFTDVRLRLGQLRTILQKAMGCGNC